MIRPGLVFVLWCAIATVVVMNDLVGDTWIAATLSVRAVEEIVALGGDEKSPTRKPRTRAGVRNEALDELVVLRPRPRSVPGPDRVVRWSTPPSSASLLSRLSLL